MMDSQTQHQTHFNSNGGGGKGWMPAKAFLNDVPPGGGGSSPSGPKGCWRQKNNNNQLPGDSPSHVYY